jgi:hypothetical protein
MIVRLRSIVIAVGLTVWAFFAPSVAAQDAEKPTFRVENDTIDVGKVVAGKTASVTYVFHNDGPTDITILRASPS